MAEGFYNLEGPVPGFHGHLRLDRIAHVRFQNKPHRGRKSYAFCFEENGGETVFKIFLGRDTEGELIPEQVAAFQRLRNQAITATQTEETSS